MKRSALQISLIISLVVILVAFAATFFLFFQNLKEIPLGILFGGSCSILSMALFLIGEHSPNHKKVIRRTIRCIVYMALIHTFALTLAGVLYYVCHLRIFNIFATFGSIFVAQIAYAIVNLFHKDEVNG